MIILMPDPPALETPGGHVYPHWYQVRLRAAHEYLDQRDINRNRRHCDHRYVPALPMLPVCG
jgi:hypothetical protein